MEEEISTASIPPIPCKVKVVDVEVVPTANLPETKKLAAVELSPLIICKSFPLTFNSGKELLAGPRFKVLKLFLASFCKVILPAAAELRLDLPFQLKKETDGKRMLPLLDWFICKFWPALLLGNCRAPLASKYIKLAPLEEATVKGFAEPDPCTAKVEATVLVPMLKYLLVLSQKKLELFCASWPPLPANKMEPWVKVARVIFPEAKILFHLNEAEPKLYVASLSGPMSPWTWSLKLDGEVVPMPTLPFC